MGPALDRTTLSRQAAATMVPTEWPQRADPQQKRELIVWLFMILIFGLRSARSVIAVVPLVCRRCNVRADQRVVRRVLRLTVFFIPVLPVWTSHLLQCSNCGAETRVSAEQAERSVDWALSHETR